MSRCNYILGRLENWDNKSVVNIDKLTIEHIIPQNPHLSAHWVSALGNNWSEIQKIYLHTIGNLTLTAYNPEMSDSSFTDKLIMKGGFKESALHINLYVNSQTSWGVLQLTERARQLGEVAQKAWPYPTLTEKELEPYIKHDPTTPEYTVESYPNLNSINRELFESLNTRILNLSTGVERKFNKHYIAYKADTNFVGVTIQKSCLKLTIHIEFDEVIDPKGICKETTNKGKWVIGSIDIKMNSLDMLDDVMAIIKQAYRLQDVE